MPKSEKISARIAQICKDSGQSQQEIADRVGIRADSLSRIKRGRAGISHETARAIEREMGYRADWILRGEGPRRAEEEEAEYKTGAADLSEQELLEELRRRLKRPGARVEREPVLVWGDQSKVRQQEALENFRAVPLMADAAAAGHGRVVEEEIESWAVIHSSVVPEGHEVRAVRVEGESMSPLLPEGTIVAVDFSQADPEAAEGRIVAARREGEVLIKWWHVHDGHVVLESENPSWSPIYLEPGQEQEALLGQVVWAWQDLRQISRRH